MEEFFTNRTAGHVEPHIALESRPEEPTNQLRSRCFCSLMSSAETFVKSANDALHHRRRYDYSVSDSIFFRAQDQNFLPDVDSIEQLCEFLQTSAEFRDFISIRYFLLKDPFSYLL